jgi:cytochrome c biogenesis protein CcdA
MTGLSLLVASIAIADSINPSTLVPALWLAGAREGRGLASYTLGVFAIYLAGGLVLVLGPGPALIAALHHVGGSIEHGLEAAGGVGALVFAVFIWRSGRPTPGEPADPPELRLAPHRSPVSAFALGAGIMLIELPTAFMYFGAISAILAGRASAPGQIALLLVYNVLFVAPLIAILLVRRLAGERGDRWLAGAGAWLRRAGRVALTGVVGAGGAALLVLGLGGLLAA